MYRYIIVDDEPLIRKGILKKIQAIGFDGKLELAGEAENGTEGLALIRRVNPDIILTDMRMPEMDGKDFLKKLQDDHPDKKIIVISGYSDYEYMKEAISAKVVGYLLKPFNREEIQETLEKAIRLIEAERTAEQQLAHLDLESEEIKVEADIQTLASLILGLHHREKAPHLRSGKLQFLGQADRLVLMTVIARERPSLPRDMPERCVLLPNPNRDHMVFGLLALSGTEPDREETVLRWAQSVVRLFPGSVAGVSAAKPGLPDLHEAYEETLAALNARTATASPEVAFYRGDPPSTNRLEWPHVDELLFFVESGNAAKVAEYVDQLFEAFQSDPNLTLAEIKNTCESIILEVRNILYHYFRTNGNRRTSTSFSSFLESCFDVPALKHYMMETLPGIARLLGDHSDYASDNVINNIKTYIHKNLNKTLTLEKIASLFFLNPSYCSYLFKEKTGINFVDYVNHARIDKAKELLKTSDEKVYKIAKSLGFENTKYFFRVFKKITGMTPEEYRMRAKKTPAS